MTTYLLAALLLPLVFLLFWATTFWPLWQISRDERNLAEAEKDLPDFAIRLKLRHRKGDGLGSYSGYWNRHKVRVEPQHYLTTVGIFLREDPQFSALHRGVAEKSPFDLAWVAARLGQMLKVDGGLGLGGDAPRFDFGDPVLDSYFQTRQLMDRKAEPLVRDLAVRMVLRDFLDRNHRAVKNLSIGAEVSCSLWVGSSTTKTRLFSITGKQASLMLHEMLPIAEVIEKAMGFTEHKRPADIEPL